MIKIFLRREKKWYSYWKLNCVLPEICYLHCLWNSFYIFISLVGYMTHFDNTGRDLERQRTKHSHSMGNYALVSQNKGSDEGIPLLHCWGIWNPLDPHYLMNWRKWKFQGGMIGFLEWNLLYWKKTIFFGFSNFFLFLSIQVLEVIFTQWLSSP